jgi:hypothetical protein
MVVSAGLDIVARKEVSESTDTCFWHSEPLLILRGTYLLTYVFTYLRTYLLAYSMEQSPS